MFLNRPGGIRLRLMLLVFLAAFPSFVMFSLFTRQQWDVAQADAKHRATVLTQDLVSAQKQQIQDTAILLQAIAQQLAWQTPQDLQECEAQLAKLLQRSPQYANLGIADTQGKILCSGIPTTQATYLSDPSLVPRVMANRSLSIGQFDRTHVNHQPVLRFAYPVEMAHSTSVGAIAFASLNLRWLNQDLEKQLPTDLSVSIFDRQGRILAHSTDSNRIGQSVQDTSLFHSITHLRDYGITTIQHPGINGIPKLFAISQISLTHAADLYVAVGIPQFQIQREVSRLLWLQLLLISGFVLTAIALAWHFAKTGIQQPLLSLAQIAQRLAQRDFAARSHLADQQDEFGQVAAAFDAMAAQLENHIAQEVEIRKEQEVLAMQTRFISVVSHEFRTPLATIRVASELLERMGENLSPERKQQYFSQINQSLRHMTQMIEDVLLLGRANAGRLEFAPMSIDPVAFCANLVTNLQTGIARDRVIIFTHDSPSITAYLDENLLQKILSNLLSNAIKYSASDSTIYFNLHITDQQILFQVRDEGIGIPAADLPHLFETFRRASNVGKTTGTGLGLAIVKQCVEQHQGHITVSSEEGVGTRIEVSLPNLPKP